MPASPVPKSTRSVEVPCTEYRSHRNPASFTMQVYLQKEWSRYADEVLVAGPYQPPPQTPPVLRSRSSLGHAFLCLHAHKDGGTLRAGKQGLKESARWTLPKDPRSTSLSVVHLPSATYRDSRLSNAPLDSSAYDLLRDAKLATRKRQLLLHQEAKV